MSADAVTFSDVQSADWSLALDQVGAPSGSAIGQVVQSLADISQCIRIILTTPQGSDPLRPTFASNLWRYIDWPIDRAIAHIVREVFEAITIWEPRVNVLSVGVQKSQDPADMQGAGHLIVTTAWQLNLSIPLIPIELQRGTTVVTVSPASILHV
jgi:phage baseplate assembly protein W